MKDTFDFEKQEGVWYNYARVLTVRILSERTKEREGSKLFLSVINSQKQAAEQV